MTILDFIIYLGFVALAFAIFYLAGRFLTAAIQAPQERAGKIEAAWWSEFDAIHRQLNEPMQKWIAAGPMGTRQYHEAAEEYARVEKIVENEITKWRERGRGKWWNSNREAMR